MAGLGPFPPRRKSVHLSASTEDRLREERVKLLSSMLPTVLVANLVNGTVIAAVFAAPATLPTVIVWWAAMLAVCVVRGALWRRYRRRGGSSRRWLNIAILGSAASGALWGAAGFDFYSAGNDTQRMVLGFVLGGMGAGAVTALTPSLPAFYAFLFAAVVPFCVQLVRAGDEDHLFMGTACALYLGALVVLGKRANGWLRESILRRFENSELVRSLEQRVDERTAALHRANEQLQRDIAERRRAESVLAKYGERQAAIADFGRLALSGIALDALFAHAAALVRSLLDVVDAMVIEDPDGEARGGESLARAGRAPSAPALPAGLSDHVAAPLDTRRMAVTQAGITLHGQPFGMLVAIAEAPRTYTANDISFLQSIANMLAAAIERKRAEQDIQKLALSDPLTGLPNRTLFRSQLQQQLIRLKRFPSTLAVLLIDLDNFKDVNDTLGHPAGDRLLVLVAERLKACLRETDAPARLGGDEFALILPDLRSADDSTFIAEKVIACLAEPFFLDGHDVHLGASVGTTICPEDGVDVDGLLRNADLALYRAKAEGRGAHRFYSSEMTSQLEERTIVERDLRHAVKNDELFLEYQPLFDLKTGRPSGAEALLRWRHPVRGVLAPQHFVPIAEASGLIIPVGRWVLRQAVRQMVEWRIARLPPIVVAANISLNQCRRAGLVADIEELAAHTYLGLDWLELEVTEQLFMTAGLDECCDILGRLRDLGVRISIDDFGTGYSSLERLRSLPVDKVKIDKTFVRDIGTDRGAEAIVRAIIALVKSLDLTVAAEGVENEAQLQFLIAEGCDYAQGYHLGLPLSAPGFAAVLREAPTQATRGGIESGGAPVP